MSDTVTSLTERLKPALDRYADEIAKHGHKNESGGTIEEIIARYEDPRPSCRCGWEPRGTMMEKSRRRAVGLHATAMKKRADKQYDAELAEIIKQMRSDEQAQARLQRVPAGSDLGVVVHHVHTEDQA